MKINSINIENFLGAKSVQAQLNTPIALFCGKNYAGKSSVADAVKCALTADTTRVKLKNQSGSLVSDGADFASIEVFTDVADYAVTISAKGKIADSQAGNATPPALHYVLDAQKFCSLEITKKREFLYGLMGIKGDADDIKARLLAKNLHTGRIDAIAPILKAGIEPAQKEAAAKARDSKASYKTVTGGDTWGSEKSGKWEPITIEVDAEQAEKLAANALQKIEELDESINAASAAAGKAVEIATRNNSIEHRRAELQAKVDKLPRLKTKLEVDQGNLEKQKAKVEATKAAAEGEFEDHDASECPCCGELLQVVKDKHLGPVIFRKYNPPQSQPDMDAVRRLPEEQKTLDMLESTVKNDNRDIAEAENAIKLLEELQPTVPEENVEDIKARIDTMKEQKKNWQADHKKYSDLHAQAIGRDDKIKQARKLHADILAWTAIAKALEPDGIQAEILAEALEPINKRLGESHLISEWEIVTITADMQVLYGTRDYSLCSESEKWRCDAMIAEAISYISGLKILVLDRIDVLDPQKGRGDLFYWLDDLSTNGDLNTALLFGTLKAVPKNLEGTITGFWIEDGRNVVEQVEILEAA